MAIAPKQVRVFTRDNPVTKVELYNCFFDGLRYARRAVVEARGEIGINAIKYLKRESYAREYSDGGVDFWELTPQGEAWLDKGLARHLELHPEDRRLVKQRKSSHGRVPRTRR